jgi:hypothetical protein
MPLTWFGLALALPPAFTKSARAGFWAKRLAAPLGASRIKTWQPPKSQINAFVSTRGEPSLIF